jgi:hypothetical protein
MDCIKQAINKGIAKTMFWKKNLNEFSKNLISTPSWQNIIKNKSKYLAAKYFYYIIKQIILIVHNNINF